MKILKDSCLYFLMYTLLLGAGYPTLVTVGGKLLFGDRAGGSPVSIGDRLVGSRLIGQMFTEPRYFWGRPSATTPAPYNAESSAGSNVSPKGDAFRRLLEDRTRASGAINVPVDLVTASASGLDPHISIASARIQAERVALSRKLSREKVEALIERHAEGRLFGVFGEPRVNVLELNIDLDMMS